MPNTIMMTLGTVRFDAITSPLNSTDRTTSYNWTVQDILNGNPVANYNGESAEQLTLSGTLHPTYRGQVQTLNDLRTMAQSGKPQTLTASNGQVLGQWLIQTIRNSNSQLLANGTPTTVGFTVDMVRYYG